MSNEVDAPPNTVDVTSVTYNLDTMTINWDSSSANDFSSYELLQSDSEDGQYTSVTIIDTQSTTTEVLTDFDPLQENWFKVKVTDYWGLNSTGEAMSNEVDAPPIQSELYPILFDSGSFIIKWQQNSEYDFKSYTLYQSSQEDMSDQVEVFISENNSDTSNIVSGVELSDYRYYQLIIEDKWGLQTTSSIKEANSYKRFSKNFGGLDSDIGFSVQQTSDSGFVVTGRIESFGNGGGDAWLIKTDADGNEQWNQTIGGSLSDYTYSIIHAVGGGFILTGYTYSSGNGNRDVWLIKTDIDGNEEWTQTYGGISNDYARSVRKTADGGYIIIGYTESFGDGGNDIWLIKTDGDGNEMWTQTFGDAMHYDYGWAVEQSADGGYILTGNKISINDGNAVVWLKKTDYNGDVEWNKNIYGSSYSGYSIQQTSDGGYIITGRTESIASDVWVYKTDSQGNREWEKTFGGGLYDIGYDIKQTFDGGYMIIGHTESYGNGSSDVWLIKINSLGIQEWNRTFGGSYYDKGYFGQQTFDGGYVIVGSTTSFGNGGEDLWIIKTDSKGNTVSIAD